MSFESDPLNTVVKASVGLAQWRGAALLLGQPPTGLGAQLAAVQQPTGRSRLLVLSEP